MRHADHDLARAGSDASSIAASSIGTSASVPSMEKRF